MYSQKTPLTNFANIKVFILKTSLKLLKNWAFTKTKVASQGVEF